MYIWKQVNSQKMRMSTKRKRKRKRMRLKRMLREKRRMPKKARMRMLVTNLAVKKSKRTLIVRSDLPKHLSKGSKIRDRIKMRKKRC